MGIGNTNDEGNKKSNFNFQNRALKLLTDCCSESGGSPPTILAINGIRTGVCEQTETYNVVGHSPDITSYTWVLPPNCSIVAGDSTETVDISFDPSFVSGTIRVWATNAYGDSNTLMLFVTSLPDPIFAINGPTEVADSESGLVYSCDTSYGASEYTWEVPGDATIIAGNGTTTIIVDWGSSSGNVKVAPKNSCGTRALYILPVSVV